MNTDFNKSYLLIGNLTNNVIMFLLHVLSESVLIFVQLYALITVQNTVVCINMFLLKVIFQILFLNECHSTFCTFVFNTINATVNVNVKLRSRITMIVTCGTLVSFLLLMSINVLLEMILIIKSLTANFTDILEVFPSFWVCHFNMILENFLKCECFFTRIVLVRVTLMYASVMLSLTTSG